MTLQDLIDRLEQEDPETVVPIGFHNPHSYRGIYRELAFEPKKNVTVGEMLDAAREAKGSSYTGYKGGAYEMSGYTPVHLAKRGFTGETIGPVLLDYMLGKVDA